MVNTPSKAVVDAKEIFDALERWINQRPGLDPANYGSEWKAYRSELRSIGKDRQRATKALDEAHGLTPARPELLIDSFRAFSGRLQWVPAPCNSIGVTTGLVSGHLEYTTGQYWPTEYRKAAASVLETYIAAWRQAYAAEHPVTFEYRTIEDVIAANESIGGHYFDQSTMRFFKSRIESGAVALHDESGRPTRARFITSEKGPDGVRKYSIREAQPNGTIKGIGQFQAYPSRNAARVDLLVSDSDA